MSWIHATNKKSAVTSRVSTSEILDRFEEEQEVLSRVAFLITGDAKTAECSISTAREIAMSGANPLPFREQLTEWVKWVTIKAAISHSRDEIGRCKHRYLNQTCVHAGHLLDGNDSKLQELRNFL